MALPISSHFYPLIYFFPDISSPLSYHPQGLSSPIKSVSTLALNCRIFPSVAVDVGSIWNRLATDWSSFGQIIIDHEEVTTHDS